MALGDQHKSGVQDFAPVDAREGYADEEPAFCRPVEHALGDHFAGLFHNSCQAYIQPRDKNADCAKVTP